MLVDALVAEHDDLRAPEAKLRYLVLRGPLAEVAKPGQFVHIRVSGTHDPLLRRPISIAAIDRGREEITLCYRVQGRGTGLLAQVKPGETLNVLGPLGNGFSLPTAGELILVAGGIGVFPLYALAQAASAAKVPVRLFWGGENASFLKNAGLTHWWEMGLPLHLSTLDGSLGQQGLVTDFVQEYFGQRSLAQPEDAETICVAACGPAGMLRRLSLWCREAGIALEVSLEERMGCAVGACLGCVCTLRGEDGSPRRAKVCSDGPVFQGQEVVWDAEIRD